MPIGIYIRTEKTRKILSEAHKGIPNINKGKKLGKNPQHSLIMKGRIPWNKGKKLQPHTEEHKRKISNKLKGIKPKNLGLAFGLKGKLNNNWKGGITPLNKTIRGSLQYKIWRLAIFKRDNYTCVWCSLRSGNGKKVYLQADHIKQFAYYPDLRFSLDNGRTLCVDCHRKTNTYGKRK